MSWSVGSEVVWEEFQRSLAIQLDVHRAIDDSHPAFTGGIMPGKATRRQRKRAGAAPPLR
jgi:hypothetical protein